MARNGARSGAVVARSGEWRVAMLARTGEWRGKKGARGVVWREAQARQGLALKEQVPPEQGPQGQARPAKGRRDSKMFGGSFA